MAKDTDKSSSLLCARCGHVIIARAAHAATIGVHIDTDYCDTAGIKWTNAPGCNSKSVEQYIASTLVWPSANTCNLGADHRCGWCWERRQQRWPGSAGDRMKVLKTARHANAPEGPAEFVSLKQVMVETDIITLHVPLETKGEDATFHLGNADFFSGLKKKPVVINSCRGEVVDTISVKSFENRSISGFVCDCWENEPNTDLELLAMTEITTPHIAGYSKDGKAGTEMSVHAISKYFNLGLKTGILRELNFRSSARTGQQRNERAGKSFPKRFCTLTTFRTTMPISEKIHRNLNNFAAITQHGGSFRRLRWC